MALFGAIDAATSGLTVSRVWLDAISDNVSNVNTVRSPDQEPFRARMVVVGAIDRGVSETGGARVQAITERPGDPNWIFDPSHPLADERGYVLGANVDLSVEMTNMIIANRSYQANLRMVEVATDTYRSALQIGQR
jgi:flagellar basal-body rod protein FlgC